MKKSLLSLAASAVLGLASANASAEFLDFQVNEAVVPGSLANIFTADKLNGGYTEYLMPTSGTTFSASAVGTIGLFFKNEGVDAVSTQLNAPALFGAAGYKMYALFTASGNITGPNAFEGTSGSFQLYLDVNSDTTFTAFNTAQSALAAPAADAGVTFNDDLLLASSLTGTGTGNLNGPPGAFDITFTDFNLSAFGQTYFFDPSPFHMVVNVNGDYDVLSTLDPLTGLRRITGDVSAVFKVPEPGSMALMGLGLAALGLTQRRRKVAAK